MKRNIYSFKFFTDCRIGFIIIALFISSSGFAQIRNFDLSKYKLPELRTRLLETNFNLNSTNQVNNYTLNGYDYDLKYNSYSGLGSIRYYSYLNTYSKQKEVNASVNFSLLQDKLKDISHSGKAYSYNPGLTYSMVNRHYQVFKTFFEHDLMISSLYGKTGEKDNNLSTDKFQKNIYVNASVPLKIGIGRIEQVQDARQAVYIMNELIAQNRISPDLSTDQVIDFARFISQLKSKRFFDSRIRRIYELEAIDSFLRGNDSVKIADARYFTSINDLWEYGNGPVRNSGTRVSLGIFPGYFYQEYELNSGTSYFTSIQTYTINGGIEFSHEKPINLYWQSSVNVKGVAGIMKEEQHNVIFEGKQSVNIPNVQVSYSHQIGFYPNTRTSFVFRYAGDFMQTFGKADDVRYKGKAFKVFTNLALNYYISPRLRLNVSSALWYEWGDSEDIMPIVFNNINSFYGNFKGKKFQHDLNATLAYSIF